MHPDVLMRGVNVLYSTCPDVAHTVLDTKNFMQWRMFDSPDPMQPRTGTMWLPCVWAHQQYAVGM